MTDTRFDEMTARLNELEQRVKDLEDRVGPRAGAMDLEDYTNAEKRRVARGGKK